MTNSNTDLDLDKLLEQATEMDKEVKQFLIVNHTDEEKETFTQSLNEKYMYIKDNNPAIFKMIIGGNTDIEKLHFIISMARDVKNNKISEHSASVEVGKKIFSDVIDKN